MDADNDRICTPQPVLLEFRHVEVQKDWLSFSMTLSRLNDEHIAESHILLRLSMASDEPWVLSSPAPLDTPSNHASSIP